MAKVNLDALIPREDFDIKDTVSGVGARKDTISVNDLKKGEFFFSSLRKPDFQRETSEWDPKKIAGVIDSFLDGDLIPAVILWSSRSNFTFVIDGAHRLSALAAWINDDYGDNDISKAFYDGIISDKQISVAQKTRSYINKNIGSFKDYILATEHPDKVKPHIVERSKRLGVLAVQVQWVQGDSSKAEASFFKINQEAAPIDPTELRVLNARKKPNGIAARAIVRSGKGHKYWSIFSEEVQDEIQKIAQEINKLLFNPEVHPPIKTLDLPIGGAQNLPLVLDFINIVNNFSSDGKEIPIDGDGKETIKFLMNCKRIAERINSQNSGSLGLHPVIYFYSQNGKYKIASFFAVTSLILELEKRKYFNSFTSVRNRFEELLIKNDYLIQQIVRQYRSANASFPYIKNFYLTCIEKILEGKSDEEVVKEIVNNKNFHYLVQPSEDNEPVERDFSSNIKSAAFIREAISSPVRCKICGARVHKNSISIDHKVRKQDGGMGDLENAQISHLYCNTSYKN